MKNWFLFLMFVLSINILHAQVLDTKKRIFSLERIVSIDKNSLAKDRIIILHLENGIDVQIQEKDAITHFNLFNTYPGCKNETYSKLNTMYYRNIKDGNFQSYLVYLSAFYNLGHIYDYEFSIVEVNNVVLNYYLVTYVSTIPEDGEKTDLTNENMLYINLNDGKSLVKLKVNTKFNPVFNNIYCNDLVIKVRYGTLEYYEVIRDEELKDYIKAQNKFPIIK